MKNASNENGCVTVYCYFTFLSCPRRGWQTQRPDKCRFSASKTVDFALFFLLRTRDVAQKFSSSHLISRANFICVDGHVKRQVLKITCPSTAKHLLRVGDSLLTFRRRGENISREKRKSSQFHFPRKASTHTLGKRTFPPSPTLDLLFNILLPWFWIHDSRICTKKTSARGKGKYFLSFAR